jgi:fermentation-respiration switch protein FrsA (DUF1100 family)
MSRAFVSHIPWYVAYPLIAAVAYGALYWFANRSVYFPSKYPEGSWDLQAQLGAADVWLDTADGVRIHGWQVDQPGAPFVTLYFHGNAGNITDRYDHFREIKSAGSSILMIDYRGYGKSSGWPTENGIYRDADSAYDYLLKTGHHSGQIILHGESLGTAVAVDLASRRPCAAVVLEAPFTSGKDVASTVLPVIGPALIWSFDSQKKIGRIHAPMLIIHGDRDEIIPTRLGQALFAAATEPKSLWIVPGAHHNDIVETAGATYPQHLRSFYESLAAHK